MQKPIEYYATCRFCERFLLWGRGRVLCIYPFMEHPPPPPPGIGAYFHLCLDSESEQTVSVIYIDINAIP